VAGALTAPAVVGRDGELRTLRRVVRAAGQGHGALVAVTGTSGVGKTALLGAATAEARTNGVRVARAEAAELERGLALGLMRRLLGPVAREEGLLEHAPAAARALLGPDGDDAATSEHDPLTAAVALVWVAAVLAERGPLLLVVDDAQWADDASVRVLAQVRERLGRLGAVLVLAQRPEGGSPDLRALIEDPRSVRLDLRPLGPPAITELVRGRAPQASDAQVAAVVAASGGTAFYVAALADELAAGATDLGEDAPELVAGSVVRRLRAAGPTAPRSPAPWPSSRTTRSCGTSRRSAGWSPAGRRPRRTRSSGTASSWRAGPWRSLTRSSPGAVLDDLPAGGRSQEHRRAAEVLRRAGAPPHRVAMHLAAVEPAGDQALVDELVGAATAGTGPGSSETAVTLLCRALAEPPDDRRRAGVLAALGSAERQALHPDARKHVLEALEIADADQRLALMLELAALEEQAGGSATPPRRSRRSCASSTPPGPTRRPAHASPRPSAWDGWWGSCPTWTWAWRRGSSGWRRGRGRRR
jgi:hypothetical protein